MSPIVRYGGGFVLAMFALSIGLAVAAGVKKVTASSEIGPEPAQAPAAAPPAPTQPTPADLVLAAPSIGEAVDVAKPYFADTTEGPSSGAMLLALWIARHAPQPALVQWPSNMSLKQIKKDVDLARGRVACIRGDIIQIARDKSVDGLLYLGTLATNQLDFVHFYAGGDTGALVEGSRARLCGVVTGLYSYDNVRGGQTHSVQITGVFDMSSASRHSY